MAGLTLQPFFRKVGAASFLSRSVFSCWAQQDYWARLNPSPYSGGSAYEGLSSLIAISLAGRPLMGCAFTGYPVLQQGSSLTVPQRQFAKLPTIAAALASTHLRPWLTCRSNPPVPSRKGADKLNHKQVAAGDIPIPIPIMGFRILVHCTFAPVYSIR